MQTFQQFNGAPPNVIASLLILRTSVNVPRHIDEAARQQTTSPLDCLSGNQYPDPTKSHQF
jgi:hypothetical protein